MSPLSFNVAVHNSILAETDFTMSRFCRLLHRNIKNYSKKMTQTLWEEMPQYFITSATSSDGKEELLAYIDEINQQLEISS